MASTFLYEELEEFEITNLIRLGLIKYVKENVSNFQTLKIANYPKEDYLYVDLDIDIDYNEYYTLTELGQLFINACSEKKTIPLV